MSESNLKQEASGNAYVEPTTSAECTASMGRMISYAMEMHGEQKYAKSAPYIVHCIGVSNVASRFGFRVDDVRLGYFVHMGCVGHDILEDTDAKYREVEHRFGKTIAEVVYLLADEKGRDRDEKNAKTWPEIRKNDIARAVKLCDRIFNMETSISNRARQLDRYVAEYPGFRTALCIEGKYKELWDYLDTLTEQGRVLLTQRSSARTLILGG
jgi:(p)ppGpp synthase/HD superfamily hydrolase